MHGMLPEKVDVIKAGWPPEKLNQILWLRVIFGNYCMNIKL